MKDVSLNVGNELHKQRPERTLGCNDGCALKGQSNATIRWWIVEIGDSPSDEVSKNIGVIRLSLSVVALATHVRADRIPESCFETPLSKAEITRILMEENREDSVSNDRAVEAVSVARSESFGVA